MAWLSHIHLRICLWIMLFSVSTCLKQTTRRLHRRALFCRPCRTSEVHRRRCQGFRNGALDFPQSSSRLWMASDSQNRLGQPDENDHRVVGMDWNARTSSLISRASFVPTLLWDTSLVLAIGVVSLVFFGILRLYVDQENMLYLPDIMGTRHNRDNPPGYRSPAEYDIPYEDCRIPTRDGIHIHAWLLRHPVGAKERPTIVFFHGNAGNIGIRLPNAERFYHDLYCNVLMVEYRGYGDSDDAKPTEEGLKLDAEASIEFLRSHADIDSCNIFLFGRSLGGAVSFHTARWAQHNNIPLKGMIIENTFLSVGHMVDALLPALSPFKGILLKMNWDCEEIAPQLMLPIFYLAGDSDEIVPHSHMLKLYETSRNVSKLARVHVIEGGTHNDTWIIGGRQYWDEIQRFMKDVTTAAT